MIGISGLAGSGKDTLALCLKKILEEENVAASKMAFADEIKKDLYAFLLEKTGLNIFDYDDKKQLRPILVEYAEVMKKKFGQDFWAQKLLAEKNDDFIIISDLRFAFEIDLLRDDYDGFVFHISMEGNYPINEIEKLNDPILKDKSDIKYLWPKYKTDKDDKWWEKVMDHARILWQMIPEEKKEKWKIYN